LSLQGVAHGELELELVFLGEMPKMLPTPPTELPKKPAEVSRFVAPEVVGASAAGGAPTPAPHGGPAEAGRFLAPEAIGTGGAAPRDFSAVGAVEAALPAVATPTPAVAASGRLTAALPLGGGGASHRRPRAVWFSINPRNGDIQVYEARLAQFLERTWSQGDEKVQLGEEFGGLKGFTIEFRPRKLQVGGRGSRDVDRVVLDDPSGILSIFVSKVEGRDWRVAAVGAGDKRQLRVDDDKLVEALREPPHPAAAAAAPAAPAAAKPAAPPAAVAPHSMPTPEAPAVALPAEETWVTWLSVDPRVGELSFYPPAVSQLLEAAFKSGKDSHFLGEAFHGVTVHFTPQLHQTTAKGKREVQRLKLDKSGGPAHVWLHQGANKSWKVGKESSIVPCKQVITKVPDGCSIRVASMMVV